MKKRFSFTTLFLTFSLLCNAMNADDSLSQSIQSEDSDPNCGINEFINSSFLDAVEFRSLNKVEELLLDEQHYCITEYVAGMAFQMATKHGFGDIAYELIDNEHIMFCTNKFIISNALMNEFKERFSDYNQEDLLCFLNDTSKEKLALICQKLYLKNGQELRTLLEKLFAARSVANLVNATSQNAVEFGSLNKVEAILSDDQQFYYITKEYADVAFEVATLQGFGDIAYELICNEHIVFMLEVSLISNALMKELRIRLDNYNEHELRFFLRDATKNELIELCKELYKKDENAVKVKFEEFFPPMPKNNNSNTRKPVEKNKKKKLFIF